MSTELLERPTIDTQDTDGDLAHIVLEGWHVPNEDGEKEFVSTENSVVDGTVFGTPVKALCGFEWIPGKNPHKLPMCPSCVEIARERGWNVPTD